MSTDPSFFSGWTFQGITINNCQVHYEVFFNGRVTD
jgi:glucan 1,3-beta-glucosidase